MNGRFKTYREEALFPEARYVIAEAAVAAATKSLSGWTINPLADGFEGRGLVESRPATARVHLETVADGTKVIAELNVESDLISSVSAALTGKYEREVRRWLEDIRWQIHAELSSQDAGAPSTVSSTQPPMPRIKTRRSGLIGYGCGALILFVAFMFLLSFVIFPLIGLFTGHYFVVGRGHGFTLHGPWARILALVQLAFTGLIIWLCVRFVRKNRSRRI